MKTTHTYGKLTWIDLVSPDKYEVKELMKEFSLHHEIAEEMLTPTLKPKVDSYKDMTYLILHFPTIRYTKSNEKNQEVDFVVGKDFLITIRYDTVETIKEFGKRFDVNALLEATHATKHAGFLLYHMLLSLYQSLDQELERIEGALDTIEEKIFTGNEKDMVAAISKISRHLLDIDQTLDYHPHVLKELVENGATPFGKSFTPYLDDISEHYEKTRRTLDENREFLFELRETNNSLLSTKQNEIMKVLTIMAFVTFPLSLIATIFGMNTRNTPIVGSNQDFWIILSVMLILTILMFGYFKLKKWL